MRTTAILLLALLLTQTGWKPATVSTVERRYLAARQPPQSAEGYTLAWERDVTRDDTPEGRAEIRAYAEKLTGAVDEAKAARYHHLQILKEYDCARERVRFVRVMFQDSEGELIYESSKEELERQHADEWKNPAPDTVDEKILKTVCRNAELRPGEKQ
jgi:hypothetical protein